MSNLSYNTGRTMNHYQRREELRKYESGKLSKGKRWYQIQLDRILHDNNIKNPDNPFCPDLEALTQYGFEYVQQINEGPARFATHLFVNKSGTRALLGQYLCGASGYVVLDGETYQEWKRLHNEYVTKFGPQKYIKNLIK